MSKLNGIVSVPGASGQYAPRAHFTDEQVAVIRRRRNDGESCGSLAKEFGVNLTTIYRIWRCDTYSDKPAKVAYATRSGLGRQLARFRRNHKNTPVSQAGAR